jgi:ABC-type polar amino acid transport system ATPase subunit
MLKVRQLRTAHIGPVDISVDDGECLAVMGASGTGKSLMLRALVDLDVNQGDVSLDNRKRVEMEADEWRKLAALVPAESGWWTDQVGEHFLQRQIAEELVKEVGLPDCLDWEVSRLSTGERQRLAIVRALELSPRALLLDEPTAALDDDSTAVVEGLLADRLSSGMSILLVTHDPRQATRMGHRSLMMKEGKLQEFMGNPS